MGGSSGKRRRENWLDYKTGLGDQFDDELHGDLWIDLHFSLERRLSAVLYDNVVCNFTGYEDSFDE